MKSINLQSFKLFFTSKSVSGVILLVCVIISLIIANTNAGESLVGLLNLELGGSIFNVSLKYPILIWINDGLMAIFFLLVGLEIKRELIEGELSTYKQAALPVFAAIGGMLVPAVIFGLFNNNTPTSDGWGIPMATDIAFAIAILSLLGNRVPLALKVFLTASAIVDDLGAILVIAIFYSADIHISYLVYSALVFVLMILMNRFKIRNYVFYLIQGMVLWYFIHHSGIHATIAGVLTALVIPTTPDNVVSPLEKLEHLLTWPVNFLIIPLFALANTNIRIELDMMSSLFSNMGLGIMFGLMIGKPLGIFTMSWISVKMGLSNLPDKTGWKDIIAVGFLAGIGFTMSIFIAMLSYEDADIQNEAKLSILVTSLLVGVVGYTFLRLFMPRSRSFS